MTRDPNYIHLATRLALQRLRDCQRHGKPVVGQAVPYARMRDRAPGGLMKSWEVAR